MLKFRGGIGMIIKNNLVPRVFVHVLGEILGHPHGGAWYGLLIKGGLLASLRRYRNGGNVWNITGVINGVHERPV
jgi:hypothetical protein